MESRFDERIDRKNTNSLKYDFAVERGYPQDVLPLWVADMDFRAPQEVLDALEKRVRHGIFGYTEVKEAYYDAAADWFEKHFAWRPRREWAVKAPGVVFAVAVAIRAFTKEGEGVMIQRPVYYPFTEVILQNRRKLVNNPLCYESGSYFMNFEDLERKIVENQVKLFLLCSPHNPVGRVWSREELCQVGEICRRHQVLVVSDEIHCDFTYESHTHYIFAGLGEEEKEYSIICTAPSKTFNLVGLQISDIYIPNENLRRAFCKELEATGCSQMNTMGLCAAEAAYRCGEDWFTQLKQYLTGNLNYVREYLQNKLPQIKLVEPQGTYLAWLDCGGLGYTDQELNHKILHQGGLWLDRGILFGDEGSLFQRINIACPRSVLEEAMGRLEKSFLS